MRVKSKTKIILGIFILFFCWVLGDATPSLKGIAQNVLIESSFIDQQILSGTQNSSREGPYRVLRVVDGDTIDIEINGKTERVRLIGINTPETVDPRKTVECFGKEASIRAKEMLASSSIYIEKDNSQQNRDKYDRLLRYVYLEDGVNFNKKMIEDGLAYEYTYGIPYKHQKEFKEAQDRAQREKRGLWADDACSD